MGGWASTVPWSPLYSEERHMSFSTSPELVLQCKFFPIIIIIIIIINIIIIIIELKSCDDNHSFSSDRENEDYTSNDSCFFVTVR